MRLVDVVLASVLLGLALGYLNMGRPDTASAAGTARATMSESRGLSSGRITWLRTPAMHAPAQVQ